MPRRDDQTQRTAVQARQQEAAQPEVLPVTGVTIHTDSRRGEFLATADVELAGICTIRNVKIKEDDYDLTVVMPRTKMADTREYKDACFFESRGLREQFDQAVREAYTQTLAPSDPRNAQRFEADAIVTLEVPVRFAGKVFPSLRMRLKVQAGYIEVF